MRKSFFALILLACCSALSAQQPLNNDSIVKLLKAGMSEDLIISAIQASPGAYDKSAEGLIALQTAGCSDKVISAILLKPAFSESHQDAVDAAVKTVEAATAKVEAAFGSALGNGPATSSVLAPSGGEPRLRDPYLLSDEQVSQAIARGFAKPHAIGLTLVDMQTALLSSMICSTCGQSGYTVTIYTPEEWVARLAANAKAELVPFGLSSVTDQMRAPMLHVVALPSQAEYLTGAGMSLSSSVHRVVLADKSKQTVVQPVSNQNGSIEANSAFRSISYGTAESTFLMWDVERIRGDENGEFYVVVIGDNQNKYFKVKTRMFKQLFGSTAPPPPHEFRFGIVMRPVKQSDVASLHLTRPQGVVVVSVEKGSLADKTGLQIGDVILEINREELIDLPSTAQLIRSGDARDLQVWRNGDSMELLVP